MVLAAGRTVRRMRPTSTFLACLSAALLLGSSAAAQNYDERAVRERSERFITLWNEHDVHAMSALFSEHAQFVNVVGIWWKNRGDIEAAHQATHRTLFKDSVLTGRLASLRWLRTDVAAVHLAWELKGARDPEGSPLPPRKGILLLVWTRESGSFQVQVAQNTDIVEAVLAPQATAGAK